MNEFSVAVGQRIKKLREEKGLYQYELGRLIGSSACIVSYWESGRSEPCAYYLNRLADVLGCSADYLLGRCGHE